MSRLQTPIRKNDNVLVTTGKDRGKRGRVLRVLPEGHAVTLRFNKGVVEASKEAAARPMAQLLIKDVETANRFFGGKADTFAAVASGDVLISGKIPMIDTLSLILDRIPMYLQ